MSKEYTYPDGTPMPEEHKKWFDNGPVKPETLEMWLKIIQETKDK